MPQVYVDTYFLACPSEGSTEGRYADYVYDLASLHETNSLGYMTFLLTSNAINVLESANALPPWTRSTIDLFVQREEVLKLLYGLLTKLNSLEDACKIEDILIDNAACVPSDHLLNRNGSFIEDYHRTLGFISLAANLESGGHATDIVLTKGIDDAVVILASGDILEISSSETRVPTMFPLTYAREITNVPSLKAVYHILTPLDIWQAGFLGYAIDLALFQRDNSHEMKWPNKESPYSLRESFLDSVRLLGFLHTEIRIRMALRACIETIVMENMGATHVIRTTTSPNSPGRVRARDGATAWRRDIDHEYHLHYWQTTSAVELVSIVPHRDVTIAD